MSDSTIDSRPASGPTLRGAFRPGPLGRRRVSLSGLLARVFDVLMTWSERARERHELHSMSEHSLRDIGLSRADAAQEYDKPFWRV